MPLPNDEKLLALSEALIEKFQSIFGAYPGMRPAHAKGILLKGSFTPSPGASTLTRAPHFGRPSTPVTVRFSNSTGVPLIPDNDPNAGPRGIAVRFHLGERVHTDIIAHSTDGFPTHTGEEFLEFLTAVASSAPGTASPKPIEALVGSHPAALAFVQTPKPAPASFATEAYFGVTAAEFLNGEVRPSSSGITSFPKLASSISTRRPPRRKTQTTCSTRSRPAWHRLLSYFN